MPRLSNPLIDHPAASSFPPWRWPAIVREASYRSIATSPAQLHAAIELERTLQAIAASTRRAMGADRASCYVSAPGRPIISSVHTTETDPGRRAVLERAIGYGPAELPLWRRLIEADDGLLALEDLSAGAPAPLTARLGAGALLGARLDYGPPQAQGDPGLIGALYWTYRMPRHFGDDELALAGELATMANLALLNAHLRRQSLYERERAEQALDVDQLTGLPSRPAIERLLEAEVAACEGAGRRLAVIVADIDGFTRVNERHGRGVGDDALRAVGRALRDSLRPGDLVGRLGGAEFLVALPDTAGEAAWQVAERLRRRIAALDGPWGALTASLGVAGCPEVMCDADSLIRAAGWAMYEAKTIGRDTTVVHERAAIRSREATARMAQAGREAYLSSVLALAAAVDARDHSTHAHSETVARYATMTGAALGVGGDALERIRVAGLLHDIGKIGVPDAVLLKPGPLSPAELAQMRRHPRIGADLLVHPDLAQVKEWVLCHHERPDGRGYPRGLSGARIPREALILGAADAYEAMTADRPYRTGLPADRARGELLAGRGTQFDAEVVDAFLGALDRRGGPRSPGGAGAGARAGAGAGATSPGAPTRGGSRASGATGSRPGGFAHG